MRKYFVSFITQEADLARYLRDYLNDLFQGRAQYFLSADGIGPGEDWLKRIRGEINEAAGILVLLSDQSFYRPWINIETGAFWINGKTIFPLCHGDLRISDLHKPIADFQATLLNDPTSVSQFIRAISVEVGLQAPPAYDAAVFVERWKQLVKRVTGTCETWAELSAAIGARVQSPDAELMESYDILSENPQLIVRRHGANALAINGYVEDAAVLHLKRRAAIEPPRFLVVLVEQPVPTQSLPGAFGQFFKVLVNGEVILPYLAGQRHPLDQQYTRRGGGLFAYDLAAISVASALEITMIFWKLAIPRLHVRFFFMPT